MCSLADFYRTPLLGQQSDGLGMYLLYTKYNNLSEGRSQWPRGLRRTSAAAWLLGSRVRISLGAWMFVVLSCVGRGLCDGLITRPEESYRVSVCVWSRNAEKGGQRSVLDYKRLWMNELKWIICSFVADLRITVLDTVTSCPYNALS
jgi:hypothetical protein